MEDNEKEWKTTKRNGRQQTGMEDNGMMERETDARCSASISNKIAIVTGSGTPVSLAGSLRYIIGTRG
jgi:hypothetical protein